MFHLVFAEKVAPARQMIVPGETIIGRSATSDISIDDPSVSRRQARLAVTGNRCKLVDLDSSNGTFVNGHPITEAELNDGDTVLFGDIAAKVEWSAADRLALTDDRQMIESAGTLFRPVGRSPDQPTMGGGTAKVDAHRLLKLISEISKTL